MSDVAIRVEGVSKRYALGGSRGVYSTLRETLSSAALAPLQAWRGRGDTNSAQEFWALHDVSFEVERGEVVGIIGRNGAGKSTLFKILAQITEPSAGQVEIYGHVASLLEVGTGFHPELTGRENVYLNGAILGMKRADIARKFDEIVAFAEIERFLDTPVKRYSSGMYMRLAFAVAAHLEPEILLVDEVLAVGDTAFQKKCLGKMGDVAKEGRTVLFVSHNLLAVQGLCRRVLWLDGGRIVAQGHPARIVSSYQQTTFSPLTEQRWDDVATAPGTAQVRLHRARVSVVDGGPTDSLTVHSPFTMEFEYWNLHQGRAINVDLQLYNEQGILVFHAGPIDDSPRHAGPLAVGLFRDICRVPGDLLNNGTYRAVLQVVENQGTVIHREEDILVFEVCDSIAMRGGWYESWDGIVRPALPWTTELLNPYPSAPSLAAPDQVDEVVR